MLFSNEPRYKVVIVGYIIEEPFVVNCPDGEHWNFRLESKTMRANNEVISVNKHYITTGRMVEQDKIKNLEVGDLIVVNGHRVSDQCGYIEANEIKFKYRMAYQRNKWLKEGASIL